MASYDEVLTYALSLRQPWHPNNVIESDEEHVEVCQAQTLTKTIPAHQLKPCNL